MSLMPTLDICIDKCLCLSNSPVGKWLGIPIISEDGTSLTLKQWKITKESHTAPYCLSLLYAVTPLGNNEMQYKIWFWLGLRTN